MEFSAPRRRNKQKGSEHLQKIYPHDLQMYSNVPVGQINFDEFKELGMDRLKRKKNIL